MRSPASWLARQAPHWVLLVAFRLFHHEAEAQIYKLEDTPVPGNRSMHMLYTYYIYSSEDAPERPFGAPYVKYHGLVSHVAHGNDMELKDYVGIQLSLVKYEDFWTLIDPHHFCCGPAEVEQKLCDHEDQLLVNKPPSTRYRDAAVYTHTIRFPNSSSFQSEDKKLRVRETGVYILMLSNCGLHNGAVIYGSAVVKNAYGFLPGNEYHKMPFYGWLSLIYMVMAVIWTVLSLRWWKEVFNLQHCIAAVILLGLVESFVWYIFFTDWNASGTRGNIFFLIAILASVMKSIFSYLLVLVASLGWGVTRPYLDQDTMFRIKAMSFLYIVLGAAREVVLSFQHSHSLPLAFVLLCLLPVSLLNGVIFYWVFTALSSLIQTLKDRGQTAKLLLFQRLWWILIISLSVATVTLLYQIFAVSQKLVTRWHNQWLFTDGVSHILFLFILTVMMYLWAPHQHSQRYAYSQQVDSKEVDDDGKPIGGGADPWAEEEGDDDNDDDLFTKTKADTIGASDSGAAVLQDTMAELDRLGLEEDTPVEKMA